MAVLTAFSKTPAQTSPSANPRWVKSRLNPRGFAMQDVVSNFEAYAALKQTTPNGFASQSLCCMIQQFSPKYDYGTDTLFPGD